MKLFKIICAALPALALTPAAAPAAVIDLTTLVGSWDIQDQFDEEGAYFSNSYFAPVALTAKFTDLYVEGDEYNVYVNGVFAFSSLDPGGQTGAFFSDPNVAYASGLFAHGLVSLSAGDTLSFQMLSIPEGYPDGTLAVTALAAVPEPAAWAMMIGGFALAGAAMRRRKAVVSFA